MESLEFWRNFRGVSGLLSFLNHPKREPKYHDYVLEGIYKRLFHESWNEKNGIINDGKNTYTEEHVKELMRREYQKGLEDGRREPVKHIAVVSKPYHTEEGSTPKPKE